MPVSWPLLSHAGDGTAPRPARPDGPRYVRLGPVGQGGMGTVYLGWDAWLGRNVALKVPAGPPGSPPAQALEREAQLAARLDHPGLATIHDVGEDESGQPFFVMRLAPGRPLEALLARGPSAEARRAVGMAASAVAHAHARGVVHRDLSPRNILVADHGEVSVVDWGVAANAGDADAPRRVGTPGHAPPEQAAGAAPDPTADVWCLGVLLDAAVGAEAPPDLRAVVARATDPDPARRYPDAGALADDLTAWEEGRRVAAHGYNLSELAVRFLRRWWLPLTVGGAGVALLIGQGVLDALEVAAERDRAVVAERSARDALRDLSAEAAVRVWRDGDLARAAALAADALATGPHPLAAGVALATRDHPPLRVLGTRTLPRCKDWALPPAGGVALCADGDGHLLGVPWDGAPWSHALDMVDVRNDGPTLQVLHSGRDLSTLDPVSGAVLAHDPRAGVFAFTGTQRFTLDFARPIDEVPHLGPCPFRIVALERAGDVTFTACGDGSAYRGDPAGVVAVRGPTPDVITSLVRVGDGVWAADHAGALFELGTTRAAPPFGEPVRALIPVPGDRLVLVVGGLGRARLFDTAGGRWRYDLQDPTAGPPGRTRYAVRPDGTFDRLVDRTWTHLAPPTRLPSGTWRTGRGGLGALAWTPTGDAVVVGDGEGTVFRVPTVDAGEVARWRWQLRVIKAVDVGADGQILALGLTEPYLHALRPTGEADVVHPQASMGRRALVRHDSSVLVATYGDAPYLLSADGRHRQRLREVLDVSDIALDPARERAVLVTRDALYELDRAGRIGLREEAPAIAADLDGDRLAWVDADAVHLRVGASPPRAWPHPAYATDLALWAGGVVTGARDGHLRMWDDEGTLLAELPAHADRVGAIAVSPDGTRLASAGWDGVVRVLQLP